MQNNFRIKTAHTITPILMSESIKLQLSFVSFSCLSSKYSVVFSKIQDFPGMLNFYHVTVIQFFKSSWAEIRASAAMFIGEIIPVIMSN